MGTGPLRADQWLLAHGARMDAAERAVVLFEDAQEAGGRLCEPHCVGFRGIGKSRAGATSVAEVAAGVLDRWVVRNSVAGSSI